MKRTLTLISCVAICCAMMVSCKNSKTAEPTPEEIQAMKVALADSVLAQIDAIADEYFLTSENAFTITKFELTEEEKMVKPDYLLEPSFANTLVTKSQKVNAMAIYIVELAIRKIYDIPMDEAKEVIAKLAVELNYEVPYDDIANLPKSERIRKEYEKCKEKGDLTFFWQLQHTIIVETSYIMAQNPELFFSKITDEQWRAYIGRFKAKVEAVKYLAKFDPEMAVLYDFIREFGVRPSDEERDAVCTSCEAAKKFIAANIEKYTTLRNALLQ